MIYRMMVFTGLGMVAASIFIAIVTITAGLGILFSTYATFAAGGGGICVGALGRRPAR